MGWREDRLRVLDFSAEPTVASPSATDGDEEDEETPCEASAPCVDSDECCAHGGVCREPSHAHHDPMDYLDWAFDNVYMPQIEEGRISRG